MTYCVAMTLDEIARAYVDGATAEQLAARLEASTRTVLRVLRERGVPGGCRGWRRQSVPGSPE
jgi:predicted DNA-binding transcriptional regulator YafY